MSDSTSAVSIDRARAYRIFAEALELEPPQREAFIERHCGDDTRLRGEVEGLLAFATRGESSTHGLFALLAPPDEDLEGRTFGRFKLIERIGEGGMGVVYRGERSEGVQQSVAVKLLSRALLLTGRARFEREAQLLARLEHPSVARLIDVGVEAGHAWIAIEFVRGKRIDEYCAEHDLSCRAIVALLVQIADAVAAAHRMRVVHSDIKPTNVLVTSDGQPKLIDFGIATALLDNSSTEATVAMGRLFSPGYAAPEQITGGPVTVTTDVFGLGALAYRLLTGVAPHADATGPIPYLLAITQREVKAASQAALHGGRDAAQRQLLRGDLDAILGKALERDPAGRYPTVADLRADLQRFLERRPVLARKPSLLYRVERFVRRNALTVALSALLVVIVALGGVLAMVQARRTAQAHDVNRAVMAFLTSDGRPPAHPSSAQLGGQVTAAPDAEKSLAHDLYLQGRFEWNKRTPESLNRALGLFTRSLDHAASAQAYAGLADTYMLLREYSVMPIAEAYDRALAAATKAVELDDSLAEAHRSLAFAKVWGTWDFRGGLHEFQRAIELDPDAALTHLWFATAFEAPEWYRITLREFDRAQELDPSSPVVLANKSIWLFEVGQRQAGRELARRVERANPDFVAAHRYLARMAWSLRDYPEFLRESELSANISGDAYLREATSAAAAGFRRDGERGLLLDLYTARKRQHADGKVTGTLLAEVCVRLGRTEEAIRLLQRDFEQRRGGVEILTVPEFDVLKSDFRFRQLINKLDFPPPPE